MYCAGGGIEEWNLFPQNVLINHYLWSTIQDDIFGKAKSKNLLVIAEIWLEYHTNLASTIPISVHFSFRLFDVQMQHVGSISGVYPNFVPDGFSYAYLRLNTYDMEMNVKGIELNPEVQTESSGVSDLKIEDNDIFGSFRDSLQCLGEIESK